MLELNAISITVAKYSDAICLRRLHSAGHGSTRQHPLPQAIAQCRGRHVPCKIAHKDDPPRSLPQAIAQCRRAESVKCGNGPCVRRLLCAGDVHAKLDCKVSPAVLSVPGSKLAVQKR